MPPKFQSSFIPKGPLASSSAQTVPHAREKSLFGIISLIIFIAAVAAAIGVFGYARFLNYRIAKMGESLEEARTIIKEANLDELTRLNTRLISTENLLSRHVVLSPFFEYLETSTLKSVRFTDFSFSTTDRGTEVSMEGAARGYAAVALQSDLFGKSEEIRDPVFSDLNLDERGNVTFTFTGTLNPNLLSYPKGVEAGIIDVPFEVVPAAATSTSGATSTLQSNPN